MLFRSADVWPEDAELLAWCTNLARETWPDVEVVAREKPFSFPLPTPKGNRSGFLFAGTIDLLVRENGRLKLIDWKTTAMTREQYETAHTYDTQRMGYAYAVEKLFGEPLYGMEYRVVRKAIPQTPKTTQHPKCKGAGCDACQGTGVGGISKAACDTTPEQYENLLRAYPWIDRADVQPLIDVAATRSWAWSKWQPILDGDWQPWVEETYELACAMREAVAKNRFPRNREACHRMGRAKCPYTNLCAGLPVSELEFNREEPRGMRV